MTALSRNQPLRYRRCCWSRLSTGAASWRMPSLSSTRRLGHVTVRLLICDRNGEFESKRGIAIIPQPHRLNVANGEEVAPATTRVSAERHQYSGNHVLINDAFWQNLMIARWWRQTETHKAFHWIARLSCDFFWLLRWSLHPFQQASPPTIASFALIEILSMVVNPAARSVVICQLHLNSVSRPFCARS